MGKIVAAAYRQSSAFGLLVDVSAAIGTRYSQLAKLTVGDLQNGREPRLMMPASKKGKGKKILRCPVPITVGLAAKLRKASEGRPMGAQLLTKADGKPWAKSDQTRPFKRAVKVAKLEADEIAPYEMDEITIYALRHSSIVNQILRGVPLRVVAALHDTSVQMIEKTYSSRIADHADAIARAALRDFAVPAELVALPPAPAKPAISGSCRHGHRYDEHPPYKNKNGALVCSACAKERTRRNKEAKRKAGAAQKSS